MKIKSILLLVILSALATISVSTFANNSSYYPAPFDTVPSYMELNKELVARARSGDTTITPMQMKIIRCSAQTDIKGSYMYTRQLDTTSLNSLLNDPNTQENMIETIALIYTLPVGDTIESKIMRLDLFVEYMFTRCMAQ